jgi:hypothetical protein
VLCWRGSTKLGPGCTSNSVFTELHSVKLVSTQFSPYFLNYGREIVLSGDDFATRRRIGVTDRGDEERERLLGALYKVVRENLDLAYQTQARYYNLRSSNVVPDFRQNEVVWRKNFRQSDAAANYAV